MSDNEIAVVVEHLEGRTADVTFELLGHARGLARACGGHVVAVAAGEDLKPVVDTLGAADVVVACRHPALAHYTPEAHQKALAAVLTARRPRVALVASTAMGLDLAGGLSGALGWPLVAYAREVRLDGGRLAVTSQIYGGKILAVSEIDAAPALVAMLPGAGAGDAGRTGGAPGLEEVVPALDGPMRVRFRRLLQPEAGDVDITREPVLVSVGRGIGSRDNLALVEALAAALGGTVAASRPIVDQGWLPKTRQVGKSGMTVKPKLYLAVGISGAPEHLEGMRGAELIIAINSDPGAPIFDVAHYGVTADLFEVVPALTEKIRAAQG
jgi:electron transfer flavoprotein alpha subunit